MPVLEGIEPPGVRAGETAVWTVNDERLQRGWVEQASFELYHYLLAK